MHRLLLAAVSLTMSDWWGGGEVQGKATMNLLNNTELHELCTHINSRNRAAQRAQRDSQILFQTLYFKDRPLSDPRCVVDAVIFSLKENGFLVYIPQYAVKVTFSHPIPNNSAISAPGPRVLRKQGQGGALLW